MINTPAVAGVTWEARMRWFLSVLLLSWLTIPAVAQQAGTARPNPPVLKEVTTEFPKGDQVEYRIMTAKIEPGTLSPWHTHPAPVAVYVVSGTFTLEREGGESTALNAGEAMLEPINVKVRAANHGTEPAQVLIFQVSAPEDPFLVPTE
jgi:quercetin dioxygenase-like cupin family protein